MGGLFAKLPTKSVLVIGLDGSGKSALLSAARGIFRDDLTGSLPGVVRSELIDPTAGMKLEIFTSGSAEWRCWDMSGRGTSRSLWPHFFSYVDAIIFVIDSTDIARAAVVREELDRIVQRDDVQQKNIPILFILNKIDIQKDEDEELVQKVCRWGRRVRCCSHVQSRLSPSHNPLLALAPITPSITVLPHVVSTALNS